jgi:hypothetical protein
MKISIGKSPLNNDAGIILHPIKYKNSITYEPLAEEAVVALMAKYFTYELVDAKTKKFFDEMDEGYLYSESNFDEFDLEQIENMLEENNEIIIGKDIYLHPKKDNILKLLNLLNLANFKVSGIKDFEFDEIDELEVFDGAVVYIQDGNNDNILVSNQFKIANKINKNEILINSKPKKVVVDENLKGVFGIVFENTDEYPFQKVIIS